MLNQSNTSLLESQSNAIVSQLDIANSLNHRATVVLRGEGSWQNSLVSTLVSKTNLESESCFYIGKHSIDGFTCLPANQGKRILGRDSKLLIVECGSDFDANSFNAAVGTLVGGGLLIILVSGNLSANTWLQSGLEKLPVIEQDSDDLKNSSEYWSTEEAESGTKTNPYIEQELAIDHIQQVLTGHRKRPFVMTADRGRGKSSALGIAAARLALIRPLDVIITAPNKAAVASAIFHFESELEKSDVDSSTVSLNFIAPDELLNTQPSCDLLFVDEAAAIPIPILKQIVDSYHRLVISTTIYGYEGCGRGFSLKFLPWLLETRKGSRTFHLSQPIRWNVDDPLEHWSKDTFLLNAELSELPDALSGESIHETEFHWELLNKDKVMQEVATLSSAFALLVNAHYQTSPNDLMLLLNNPNMSLYTIKHRDLVVGSVLVNREGQLEGELIERIYLGKSRPAGHLVPVELCNHLALEVPALQSCARVMRIAVHPLIQGRGIGSSMLTRLRESLCRDVDYLATTFGATNELVQFWSQNHFSAVRLGSSRDKASGTYSATFVSPISEQSHEWYQQAFDLYRQSLPFWLRSSAKALSPELAGLLLSQSISHVEAASIHPLVINYAEGGNAFNTVSPFLLPLLQCNEQEINEQLPLLLVAVIAQEWEWEQTAKHFGFTGRKQTEQAFRQQLKQLIERLQCK
ncbi:tRNA(Met) cytidine acetyltransferase [Vibrio sp. SCSIO 43140]|uniref:GNAT family N-acetyltransferase n=1 Tax=Vibrio sp. SCSIO 43140 TaxID=2819100 RepID=UPI002076373F|nr:GNAT family N-acetyltransferase [Vibrio sp. SCSIO 43140]USD63035.1 tRNA(Met) cytidine acetyltransferase [Vibrio sp. SCSIO 43140]